MGFASCQRYCTASSSGRQTNFAALNRGHHLCSAGRPSGWALAHILVYGDTQLAGFRPVNKCIYEGLTVQTPYVDVKSFLSKLSVVLSERQTVKFLHRNNVYLWSPYVIGQTIYIFILFLLLSSSFFSSPNLSSRRLDVYHTSAHGVVLV